MRFYCVCVLLLVSFFCSAQETQTDTTKSNGFSVDSVSVADSAAASQPNIIDRVMQHFEFSRGRFRSKLYPSLGYDPASGLSVGILSLVIIEPADKENKKIRFYRPTSISSMLSYSTKNWINVKSDMMIYAKHGIVVNTILQYQKSPDSYYGIGNDTLNTRPLRFDMNDFLLCGNVSKELSSVSYLGFTFDISNRQYSPLGTNDSGLELPEAKNSLLVGFGPHFTFDRRDDVNYPTQGEIVTVAVKYFAPHAKNAYSFHSIEINMKKYMRIYRDLILAMQVFNGYSNGEMPFCSMYQLGGQSRLRGISNKYMYIDKCAYYAQGELRKHIWGRFGAVVYGGFGNTYSSFSDFDTKNVKYVYGAGIRFQSDTKNNINLRLDYGRGSFGDSGVYMTMREAF